MGEYLNNRSAQRMNSNYSKTIEEILNGATKAGNVVEDHLYSIVNEVRTKGFCERQFQILNNGCFRFFKTFKEDWRSELTMFTEYFGIRYSVLENGDVIEFRR